MYSRDPGFPVGLKVGEQLLITSSTCLSLHRIWVLRATQMPFFRSVLILNRRRILLNESHRSGSRTSHSAVAYTNVNRLKTQNTSLRHVKSCREPNKHYLIIFSGISHLSTSGHLCRNATGRRKRVQSCQTCRESQTQNHGAARCSRVRGHAVLLEDCLTGLTYAGSPSFSWRTLIQSFTNSRVQSCNLWWHTRYKHSLSDLCYLSNRTQFQGKQVYGTICANCHRRSERDSDFHEIEVNIKVCVDPPSLFLSDHSAHRTTPLWKIESPRCSSLRRCPVIISGSPATPGLPSYVLTLSAPTGISANDATVCKTLSDTRNCENSLRSCTSPYCASCTTCRPWSARRASTRCRSQWKSTWINSSGLQKRARNARRMVSGRATTCINYVVSYSTRAQVLTTDIMKRRCSMLSKCLTVFSYTVFKLPCPKKPSLVPIQRRDCHKDRVLGCEGEYGRQGYEGYHGRKRRQKVDEPFRLFSGADI